VQHLAAVAADVMAQGRQLRLVVNDALGVKITGWGNEEACVSGWGGVYEERGGAPVVATECCWGHPWDARG
jgi:hypothetical protein